MVEIDFRRAIVGFFILFVALIAYSKLTNPKFFELVGVPYQTQRQTLNFIDYLGPVFLFGIIVCVCIFIFGANIVSSFMLALLGLILYYTLTSQVFLIMIGASYSEQIWFLRLIEYLGPLVISIIILGALFFMLKYR
ncbi:MAG: hypothetical protein OH354_01620 [Candidatus Parvarchaeota archaeon]|nr:hypothetical protein [Candidatus Jingweiarchaeum tengchongense]MCW1300097.1 hypothetical protein [Candidatus Jingweiarchaeum tengchongense]MCW1304451.1 hypothetical protein [Candidatus Jingweiarchaeum tengchongense]MCW1305618.1 hypothetical protein [Candidatus Jingweiarchaeum tengchongense]MCW1309261.1 hypothetical protein [Candidatus Jingweiarchaeum tengchongense]